MLQKPNQSGNSGPVRNSRTLPTQGGIRKFSPEYQAEYTRLYRSGLRGQRLKDAIEEFAENEELEEGWLPGEQRRRRTRRPGFTRGRRRRAHHCPCCDSSKQHNDADALFEGLSKAQFDALATKVYDLLLDELRIGAERQGIDYFSRRV